MLLSSLKRIVLGEDIMRPSNYNYLKRMWTRNYPKRGRGIISTIFWFPFKLCIFILLAGAMTALYIVAFAVWFILRGIWEFTKVFFAFLKDLFVGIININRNKKNDTIEFNLNKVHELANTINNTCEFNEFVHSFEELQRKLKFLSLYEDENVFLESTPTEDLKRIMDYKVLTEKEFIDRYINKYGVESLEYKKHYFTYFSLETITYITAILKTIE